MRYARIVRKHDATLVTDAAPRRFSKRATTAALDLRTVFRSLRPAHLVPVLIVAPFVFAVLAAMTHPRLPPANAHHEALVPVSFQKYRYEEIRAGADHPVLFREKIQTPVYQKILRERRNFSVDPERSVSLIAACKNRKESLALVLPSWEGVQGIDEIILVDWGSDSHDWQHLPLLQTMVKSGRISFIRVENAGDWALTRAFNLAAKFAVGKYLLKVDCDTHLNQDFIKAHPHPVPGKYYSVGWGMERNKNEQKLRGVWFAPREAFSKVGGYDERIVSYGYEDLDLYERLQKFAGLEAMYLNLDSLRHNIAGDIVWPKAQSNATTSHEISTRLNKAVISTSSPWAEVVAMGNTMQYDLEYSRTDLSLYATIVKEVPDPLTEKTAEERKQLKTDVLQKALHDEYHIPWDLIPSFTIDDLQYLADYMDRGGGDSHVSVICLDGDDAISNVFNLVSAVEVGISQQQPIIVVWRGSEAKSVDQSKGPILGQLFDLEATNALLRQVPLSETAKKHSITSTSRLIAAHAWPCVEPLSACAEQYDGAYNSFSELVLSFRYAYDGTDPLPLRVRRNGLLKLSDKTRIGNQDTRILAYKSLVPSHIVRVEQKLFPLDPALGLVFDAAENGPSLLNDVRSMHGSLFGLQAADVLPIVGLNHHSIRRQLFGDSRGSGFCEGSSCNIAQLAREVANVFAICSAEKVHPACDIPDRDSWASRRDVKSMMVADLRGLHQAS